MRLLVLAVAVATLLPTMASAQSEECPPDETCEAPPTEDGAVAPADDAAPAEDVAPTDACFPACRGGFVCAAGQCVEACNPPCGEGTSCSAAATCEPDEPMADGDRDGGYAIGAGVLGIVMAALTVGLHVVADVGVNNYWVDIGLGWGGIGLPFITAPIVGGGALSASGPGVTGILPLRIGAWVAYGLYVAGAVGAAIYAADHSGAVPEELMITLAVGGVTTELAFAVDAIYTGAQANEPVSAVPVASLVPSPDGVSGAVLGALGRF